MKTTLVKPSELLDESQRSALAVLTKNNGGLVFHKAGEGKTRIALAWFARIAKALQHEKRAPQFLVVCRRASFDDWQTEIGKLLLTWSVRMFDGIPRIKCPTITLLSHGLLSRRIVSGHLYDAVVLDEGWLFKNPQSRICKAANVISQNAPAALLSGSVMTARDPTEIYGQCYAINRHEILARTLTEFRSKYLTSIPIGNFFKFHATKRQIALVSNAIKPISSTYFPPSDKKQKTFIVEVSPTDKQERLFKSLKEDYYAKLDTGEELELKNAVSLLVKFQQISDGWIRIGDQIRSIPSNKLHWLINKAREYYEQKESVVIWCAFRHTASIIQRKLKRIGIETFKMIGGQSFDIEGWRERGCIAIATVDSGSSINHFANVATAIYYSLSTKWRVFQQSLARHDRKSSKHKTCYTFHAQTRESFDADIREIIKNSKHKERDLINLLKRCRAQ